MADLGLPIDTVEETPQTDCDILPFYSEILFWILMYRNWWAMLPQVMCTFPCLIPVYTRSVYIIHFYNLLCFHFVSRGKQKVIWWIKQGTVRQSQWSNPWFYISFLLVLSQQRVLDPAQTTGASLTSRCWTTQGGGMSMPAPPPTTVRAMTTPAWGPCTLTMAMTLLGSLMKQFSKFIIF